MRDNNASAEQRICVAALETMNTDEGRDLPR
jgi:hypothetical protein